MGDFITVVVPRVGWGTGLLVGSGGEGARVWVNWDGGLFQLPVASCLTLLQRRWFAVCGCLVSFVRPAAHE